MLGGSGCCNSGGAKKRVARKSVGKPKAAKPKAKRGGNAGNAGNAGDAGDPETDTVVETQNQVPEDLYSDDSGDQSGGARKKKGKVAAKKALSPYNKFVKKHFAILKKRFPDEKAPQIMQKVAIEWNKTKK